MPDGELRRPPQLWEQRLARTTSVLAAGVSSGDATAIVSPTPPPGSDSGVEPAPVLPPPGDFIAPSQPTLIGSVQGINVVWDGLNSAGDLWPSDTSYVEVHMDTSGPTFTLGTATLKGRLARPGGLAVTGLSRGTTYYFRLRGADPAGNVTDASTAASAQPGQISAPDIAANAITANSIVAGTITGWSINSAYLSGGTISGGLITGGTLSGAVITSSSVAGYLTPDDVGASGTTIISGDRITTGTVAAARIDVANLVAEKVTSGAFGSRRVVIGGVGETDAVAFKGASTSNGWLIAHNSGNNNLSLTSSYSGVTFEIYKDVAITGGLTASASAVDFIGVYNNNTTGLDEVGITSAGRLRRLSSTQAIKYDISPVTQTMSASVDPARVCDVVTVDPTALLDVAVAEFSVIDGDEPTDRRVLGFIAEDVADKLPIAVSRDADGNPAGVLDTSLLAALVALVQDQQATITDLRARIEALEA